MPLAEVPTTAPASTGRTLWAQPNPLSLSFKSERTSSASLGQLCSVLLFSFPPAYPPSPANTPRASQICRLGGFFILRHIPSQSISVTRLAARVPGRQRPCQTPGNRSSRFATEPECATNWRAWIIPTEPGNGARVVWARRERGTCWPLLG